MALNRHFFCDTARYYDRSRALEKFTTIVTGGVGPDATKWTIGSTLGRDNRYGHRLTIGGSGPPYDLRFVKTISPFNNYGIMSFAFRRDANQNNGVGSNSIVLAQFYNINTCLTSLVQNQDNTFSILQGNMTVGGGTVLVTSGASNAVGNYCHLEWVNKFGTGTSGATTLYLNGGQILHRTGISLLSSQWTAGSWGPSIGGFQFSAAVSGANHDYCDIILRDGTVRALIEGELKLGTDPWGDTRVICLLSLAGNGHYTDWTPSAGGDHGAMVDEAQEDGDSTYVSSAESEKRDSFEMEDLPATAGDILAVQIVSAARKEQAGTAYLKGFMRIAGTDYDSDHTNALGTTYTHVLNPLVAINGAPITVDNVNSCQSGPLLTHSTTGDDDGTPTSGDPTDPGPGGGGACESHTFPPGGMPSWLSTALIGAGQPLTDNCFRPNLLEAIEDTINSHDYTIQRGSACNNRGRLIRQTNHALWRTFCGHPDAGLVEQDHYDPFTPDGTEWA